MTEQTDRVHARCEECGKGYFVADADRTYTCKACGGTVRATEEASGPFENTITCHACKAVNHRGAHFCAECGGVLASSPPVHRSAAATEARHEALDALRVGHKWINLVAGLYRLGAVAYGFVTLVAVLALASTDVPRGPGVLVVVLSTALAVLMLFGAIQVLFAPFAWTVATASLATVVALAHLVGPNPLGLAFAWTAIWAALFWAAFWPTLKFRRLMAEHLDLYIMHHASVRTERSLKGRSARERHERLVAVMHRAARRAWKISAFAGGAIVLGAALGTWIVLARVRPADFETARAGFEAAWNASDLSAVARFFPPAIREREAQRLEGLAAGHGWLAGLPPARPAEVGLTREEDGRTRVDYRVGEATLATTWILDGQDWYLVELDLPVPPIEPVVERFLAAWETSDPKAVAGFYPEGHAGQMLPSIESSIARRGWSPFPRVLNVETSRSGMDEYVVTLELTEGDVRTEWLFRSDGRWSLQALKFPKLRRGQ